MLLQQYSTALIFTHWNEEILMTYQVTLTSFFLHWILVYQNRSGVFIGEWNYSRDTEKFRRSAKMHIFSIQVLWNTNQGHCQEIHFSIHTNPKHVSLFFSFEIKGALGTLQHLISHICSLLKAKKGGARTFPNKRALNITKIAFHPYHLINGIQSMYIRTTDKIHSKGLL